MQKRSGKYLPGRLFVLSYPFLIFLFSDILKMNIKNEFNRNSNIYEKWRI